MKIVKMQSPQVLGGMLRLMQPELPSQPLWADCDMSAQMTHGLWASVRMPFKESKGEYFQTVLPGFNKSHRVCIEVFGRTAGGVAEC
jgi:hypothetical protein